MKLVSFPHYTCGGLICDILNDTWSDIADNGGVQSLQHSLGKIGDSDTVYEDFDPNRFLAQMRLINTQDWVGTHCWLGNIDLSPVDRVINVTTATYRSKLYRWVRSYYHYHRKSPDWQGITGMAEIDKQRETAKNYLVPFRAVFDAKVVNLEFADVVECAPAFVACMGDGYQKHHDRWREANPFLYSPDIWQSPLAQRLYEAEHEANLRAYYVYE